MKKILLLMSFTPFLWSCNTNKDKLAITGTTDNGTKDLPYKASYSSNFSTDVSDADLKTVLISYKDWADGNMSNVAREYGDSLEWDRPNGEHYKLPNADI